MKCRCCKAYSEKVCDVCLEPVCEECAAGDGICSDCWANREGHYEGTEGYYDDEDDDEDEDCAPDWYLL